MRGGNLIQAVQRTGWGKSAVYFVASLLLRRRGAGPTLIVSPLLALMRDQKRIVGNAVALGCVAVSPDDAYAAVSALVSRSSADA